MDTKHIGARVKTHRQAQGMSCASLAALAEVSRGTIERVERGEGSPSIATLDRIATALGVTLVALTVPEPTRNGSSTRRKS